MRRREFITLDHWVSLSFLVPGDVCHGAIKFSRRTAQRD
jgi:hypothetical protein